MQVFWNMAQTSTLGMQGRISLLPKIRTSVIYAEANAVIMQPSGSFAPPPSRCGQYSQLFVF